MTLDVGSAEPRTMVSTIEGSMPVASKGVLCCGCSGIMCICLSLGGKRGWRSIFELPQLAHPKGKMFRCTSISCRNQPHMMGAPHADLPHTKEALV